MLWVPLLIILALLAFWFWMFNDMLNNPELPACFISVSGGQDIRKDWITAFIILSVFTAGHYYLSGYSKH